MKLLVIFNRATNTKFKFNLALVFHIVFYLIACFYAGALRPAIIFSAIWTIGYISAIRRFFANPINDFSSIHISYAQPNMYWVNFVGHLVRNSSRFLFILLIHLLMTFVPTFIYKNILNKPLIILVIFISNAILPITYLYVLKKLYLTWIQKNNNE